MHKLLAGSVLPLFLFLLLSGCPKTTHKAGEIPDSTSGACVDKIQQSICPSGSFLDLDAAEGLNCGGELGITVKDEGGKVSGVCATKDGCKFKCTFPPTLCSPNGFSKVTIAEVTCK